MLKLDQNRQPDFPQINGFGNGAFDWTTTDDKNCFTDSEGLHIIPTLTNETSKITNAQIYDGYTLNLTKAGGDGSCTGTTIVECSVHSNRTKDIVIPPIRSARINTKGKKSIHYGRVEVEARLPRGDWLWPAICTYSGQLLTIELIERRVDARQ